MRMNQWNIGDVKITRIIESEGCMARHLAPSGRDSGANRQGAAGQGMAVPVFTDEKGKLRMSIHALVIESQGQAHHRRYLHRQRQGSLESRTGASSSCRS